MRWSNGSYRRLSARPWLGLGVGWCWVYGTDYGERTFRHMYSSQYVSGVTASRLTRHRFHRFQFHLILQRLYTTCSVHRALRRPSLTVYHMRYPYCMGMRKCRMYRVPCTVSCTTYAVFTLYSLLFTLCTTYAVYAIVMNLLASS